MRRSNTSRLPAPYSSAFYETVYSDPVLSIRASSTANLCRSKNEGHQRARLVKKDHRYNGYPCLPPHPAASILFENSCQWFIIGSLDDVATNQKSFAPLLTFSFFGFTPRLDGSNVVQDGRFVNRLPVEVFVERVKCPLRIK